MTISNEQVLAAAVTLGAILLLWLLYALAVSGGNLGRYVRAQQLAWRWLREPATAAQIDAALEPPKPAPPPKPSAEPLWLLTLLQREGRLLDFLLEDIDGYANEQIGAAVRDIQRNCKKAIQEHLDLAPIMSAAEGAPADVPSGFDPSAVRLTGNVTGQPPFRGTLLHHGWRVTRIKINKPPAGQDEFVVQPAEVELT
jgi:hypothetical protein